MKLSTAEYYLREVAISLRRKNLISFASIGTVAVSLFVLGVFLILVLNFNRLAGTLESEVQISVYFKENTSASKERDVVSKINELGAVDTVHFVGRDEALERLKFRLGDQSYLLESLDDTNPLLDSLEITVKRPDMVENVAKSIAKMDDIEEVKYGQDVIEHLFDITRLVRIFGLILMILLAGATIFIIANTIRLTVFARRKEIAIMKYVGATDWFIRWPFILEGMTLGLIGGIISAIALRSFYAAMAVKIYSTLTFFPLIPQYPFMNYISVAIILSGMVVGTIGSAISLKRFLEV